MVRLGIAIGVMKFRESTLYLIFEKCRRVVPEIAA